MAKNISRKEFIESSTKASIATMLGSAAITDLNAFENKTMNTTKLQLLGHATFKVTTPESKIIVVDPWLINNPYIPKGLESQSVIDLMLITHGHEDHLDIHITDIIKKTNPKIVANNICRRYLIEQNIPENQFEAMNNGGTISLFDVDVTMVAAFHNAHIYLTDKTIAFPHATNGFVVRMSDKTTIYFAGDTSVFGDMKLIGEIYKPNIAVIPIGDRSMMGALEASYAVKLLNTKHIIPFHYGTFPNHAQTPDDFIAKTKDYPESKIHILKAGDILNCSEL
jgi:L-ascorbate metabolism protein UlaG (beta-lactamase superfamily)